MGRQHYTPIDLLRFSAAFAVMLYHLTALGPFTRRLPDAAPWAVSVTRYGYLGVDLFFIISGFVIALSAEGRTWREFLFSRGRRLYPAFWAACTLTTLVTVAPTWAALSRYAANMTLFAPYFGQESVDGVYWSLYMEVRFYLFVALILALRQYRYLVWFMAAWLALSALNTVAPIPRALGLFNLAFAPLFISGVIYSRVARQIATKWDYALLSAAIPIGLWYAATRHPPMAVSTVAVIAIELGCQAVVWSVASKRWTLKPHPAALWAGAISYPLYLVHDQVGAAIYLAFSHAPAVSGLAAAIVGSLAIAGMIHVIVERGNLAAAYRGLRFLSVIRKSGQVQA